MTTEETTTTEQTEKPDANAELRAYADRIKEKSGTLEERVLKSDIDALGLSTDDGLGLAIAEAYDGDFTEGDIAKFAAEKYKYEAPTAPVPPEVITEGQNRVGAVMDDSQPVTPDQPVDEVAQADAALVDPESGTAEAQHAINVKLASFGILNPNNAA